MADATSLFPASLAAVDEATVTGWLRHAGLLGPSGNVSNMKKKELGSDFGMLGDKLFLEDIEYEVDGAEEEKLLPAALLVKLPPAAPQFPQPFVDSCYQRECNFYKHIAPALGKLGVAAPRVFFAGERPRDSAPAGPGFALVLEHLSRPQRQPVLRCGRLTGLPEDRLPLSAAVAGVKQLARLHAAHWGCSRESFRAARAEPGGEQLFDENFVAHLDDPGGKTQLVGVLRGGPMAAAALFSSATTELERDVEGYAAFRQLGDYMALHGATISRRLGAFVKRVQACPQGLCHGDTTMENLFYNEDDANEESEAIWIDWQRLGHAIAIRDLSTFVACGLSVEERREHEKELVATYHAALRESLSAASTVAEPLWKDYSLERCFEDYAFGLFGPLSAVLGVTLMKWKPQVAKREGSFDRGLLGLGVGDERGDAAALRELQKSDEFVRRVVTALEDHEWVRFVAGAAEDGEEENPRDMGKPCNFG